MEHQRVQPVITVEFSVRVKNRRYQLHKRMGSRRGKPYEEYQMYVIYVRLDGRETWERSSPWMSRDSAESQLSISALIALGIWSTLTVNLETLALLGDGP